MTDLQKRAFKAGYDGMLLSQFMVGVPDKDKRTASIYFAKGVMQKNKELRK